MQPNSSLDGLRHAHQLGMHLNYLSTLADAAESGSNVAKLLPLYCERQTTHFRRPPLKSSASQNLRGSPINAKRSQTRDAPPFHIPPPKLATNTRAHTHTRPPGSRSPVALWEPVGGPLGERLEEDAEAWNPSSRGLQWPISKPPKEPVSHPGQGYAPPWPGPGALPALPSPSSLLATAPWPPTLSNNAHPGSRDPCSTSAGRGGISVMPVASPLKASMLLLLALGIWV